MLDAYKRIADGQLEFEGNQATVIPNPIGVGAVGGSGTRLMCQLLSGAGVAMATPVNEAGDAVEWPPYDILWNERLIRNFGKKRLLNNAYHAFEVLLDKRRGALGLSGRVGWKVPGTFHWLAELAEFYPGFQYVHLIRNGLDMAYSGNQSQALNWAERIGVKLELDADRRVTPASMFAYWLSANEQALDSGAQFLPGRMHLVRYEALCEEPIEEIAKLMKFLGIQLSAAAIQDLAAKVSAPSSVNRYEQRSWRDQMTNQQLDRLGRLGYPLQR